MLPGDPILDLIDQRIEDAIEAGIAMSLEEQDQLRAELMAEHDLDQPIPVQFGRWAMRMLRGDWGRSIGRGYDISTELGNRLAISMYLSAIAMVITLFFGVLFGTICAIRNGKFIDNLVTSVSNFGMTIPGFMIAIVLVYIFGFRLGWFPIFGFRLPWHGSVGTSIRHTVLPIATMCLGGIAGLARMTRSTMLDALNADHVRTAWAKGMREKTVILRHVLKNGLMPIISGVGGMIRGLFGGSVIIETIFVIPGVGNMLVMAMLTLDYNVIQAVTVLFTFITVMSNLVTDILYGWVDPRIQFS
jgi:peptide/nickel transport system permease protein